MVVALTSKHRSTLSDLEVIFAVYGRIHLKGGYHRRLYCTFACGKSSHKPIRFYNRPSVRIPQSGPRKGSSHLPKRPSCWKQLYLQGSTQARDVAKFLHVRRDYKVCWEDNWNFFTSGYFLPVVSLPIRRK